jgi:hypothetical protein
MLSPFATIGSAVQFRPTISNPFEKIKGGLIFSAKGDALMFDTAINLSLIYNLYRGSRNHSQSHYVCALFVKGKRRVF